MIPKTDTSGAQDAGVPAFIDATLGRGLPAEGPGALQGGSRRVRGCGASPASRSSSASPPSARHSCKQSLEAALAAERDDDKPFILMTRELTLLGYFTSQVGITENMEYVPVPTAFHGCVPLSQMKKHVYWE